MESGESPDGIQLLRKRRHWECTTTVPDCVASRPWAPLSPCPRSLGTQVPDLLIEMKGDAEVWKSFQARLESTRSKGSNRLMQIILKQVRATNESVQKLEALSRQRQQRYSKWLNHSDIETTKSEPKVSRESLAAWSDPENTTQPPTKRRRCSASSVHYWPAGNTILPDTPNRNSFGVSESAEPSSAPPQNMEETELGGNEKPRKANSTKNGFQKVFELVTGFWRRKASSEDETTANHEQASIQSTDSDSVHGCSAASSCEAFSLASSTASPAASYGMEGEGEADVEDIDSEPDNETGNEVPQVEEIDDLSREDDVLMRKPCSNKASNKSQSSEDQVCETRGNGGDSSIVVIRLDQEDPDDDARVVVSTSDSEEGSPIKSGQS